MKVDKLDFYKKLRAKLKMIQDGYLELDHYALEVDSKIEALSLSDVGQSFKCIYDTSRMREKCKEQCNYCKENL